MAVVEHMTMEWLDVFRAHAVALPNLTKFAIIMAIIAVAPALARRFRVPEIVGLLAFGVLLGPYVLDVAPMNHPIVQFFGDLGRLLLMFGAGLEIEIDLFRKAQARSVVFGVVTTIIPQLLGTAYGLAFGYGMIPAIVIGSLLSSHTLLALPIVARLGVLGFEPVVVVIGATLVADTLSLVVFGICVSVYTTGFSVSGLALQLIEVAIFVPLVLIGVSRVGAWILDKLRDHQEAYFVTMLGIMAVAGELANFINLPDIVGAFMAGLAVNSAVGDHPAKEKLDFFGKSFFIPIFFIVVGFLIVPNAVGQTIFSHFWLVAGMIAALIVGKGAAAAIAGRAFGYSRPARLTMWALTLPQVAATLAATLVGFNTLNAAGERLLSEEIFNAVLVLLVVTSVLSTILTDVFARGMAKDSAATKPVSLKSI
ncbi:cation:proton antiporter [Rhizobium sp. IBUN]|uniref:cation:proton antiporter n=1 Tax=Rhizobium sp. IBUN TaxID=1042326 RepID=UPI00041282D3|nr:cation:proton antiporter [Rhizobium sp. IBUN]